MGTKRFIAVLATAVTASAEMPRCNAEAMLEIDNASAEVRRILSGSTQVEAVGAPAPPKIPVNVAQRLEDALRRGEQVNSDLKAQIKSLEAERAQLVQAQTTLASSLIGAIVTTFVTLGGAILSARNSKPERDLKRLGVIEKARDLQQAGVSLPRDIASGYLSGQRDAKRSS